MYVTLVPGVNEMLHLRMLGERLQRYQALKPMSNQFNRWARCHRRVTSCSGSLKAREVQPALASRNEASSCRDAGSVASRGSELGLHT